jgi:hypothetical protein
MATDDLRFFGDLFWRQPVAEFPMLVLTEEKVEERVEEDRVEETEDRVKEKIMEDMDEKVGKVKEECIQVMEIVKECISNEKKPDTFDTFSYWRDPVGAVELFEAEMILLQQNKTCDEKIEGEVLDDYGPIPEDPEQYGGYAGWPPGALEAECQALGLWRLRVALSVAVSPAARPGPHGPDPEELARRLVTAALVWRPLFLQQAAGQAGRLRLDLVLPGEEQADRLAAELAGLQVPKGAALSWLQLTPEQLGYHLPPVLTEADLLLIQRDSRLPKRVQH